MQHKTLRATLAVIATFAILVSCLLVGLVLPVAADTTTYSAKFSVKTLWMMTGRYRNFGSVTVTTTTKGDDGKETSTSKTYSGAQSGVTYQIADTSIATVNENGVITAKAVGQTTITATVANPAVTATATVKVVDGSLYTTTETPFELGENLIVDGDFEAKAPTTNWSSASTTYVKDGVGKDGSWGAELSSSSADFNYKNALTFKPNTTYQVSFDYLAAPESEFYLDFYTMGSIRFKVTNDAEADGTWHTYTQEFTTPRSFTLKTGSDLLIRTNSADSAAPAALDNIQVCEYTSLVSAESVTLNYDKIALVPDQTWVLDICPTPFNADTNGTVWESGNEAVATVSAGLVTAVAPGKTTITGTLKNGKVATCVVTVGGSLDVLQNGTFEDTTAWVPAEDCEVDYIPEVGNNETTALRVSATAPVSQIITGMRGGSVYRLNGFTNFPTRITNYRITIVNGDDVLADVTNTAGNEWAAFEEISFTTPATLDSAETVLTIEALEQAATPKMMKASRAIVSGSIQPGDNEIVDDEVPSPIGVLYGYFDDFTLLKDTIEDVDLTPTELSWTGDGGDGQAVPGDKIKFSVKVENKGPNDIPAGEYITVEIAANRQVIRTLTYTGGLKNGESVVITDDGTWTATEGDWMISARVNADLEIFETNVTTNNTCQQSLRVANDIVKPAYSIAQQAVSEADMDRLTFSDDFTTLDTVDQNASGAEGYKWYVTRPWAAPTLDRDDYRIQDGILTMMAKIPTYSIGFNSVDMNTHAGFTWNKGYLEVKLRIVCPSTRDSHEVGVPAVWSLPEGKLFEIKNENKHWVEIDWLEYWGVNSSLPGGYYTTTLHEQTIVGKNDSNNKEDEVDDDKWYSNSNHTVQGLGDAEWHVMGWLWEDNSMRCFLDNVEVMNLYWDEKASAVPSVRTQGTLNAKSTDPGIFEFLNEEMSALFLGGSKDKPMEVDYVRIWQTGQPEVASDKMTLNKTHLELHEGSYERLTVSVPDGEDAGVIKWETSDPTVATVHGNGEVYARGTGSAVITATNANGITELCTVTVTHDRLAGGDFEWERDLFHKNWLEMVGTEGYTVETESSGNKVLKVTAGASLRYFNNLSVSKGKVYRLTGRFKGRTTFPMYIHSSYTANYTWASGKTTKWQDVNSTGNTNYKQITGINQDADGWYQFAVDFCTTTDTLNNNYVMAIDYRNLTGTMYVDDLVLTEVANITTSTYPLTIGETTNGSISLKNMSTGAAISSGTAVAPGTAVQVTVSPSANYQLKLGSLEYSYVQPTKSFGNVTRTGEILNKTDSVFGAGNGKTFGFVMPKGATTVSAVFEAVASSGTDQLPVATLGTSVYKDGNGDYSGIRFLNRIYVQDLDVNSSDFYVNYNGQKTKIAAFGVLLKRAENETELTLESYNANKNAAGSSKMWKTSCYRGGDAYLVDHTASYMDFTITMTSSVANRQAFLSRGYTACAYLTLEDGTTVYSAEFTDSALGALNRYASVAM